MKPHVFGMLDGQPIMEVQIRSAAGISARIISWGAVIRDLSILLSSGAEQRLVLGLNTIDDYVRHSPSFGALTGRYANRIAHGRFTLDGASWQLPLNDKGRHTLHGGGVGLGFGRRPWQVGHCDDASVSLQLHSPHGDAGFPGAVDAECTYRMLEPATLQMEVTATCDRATPLSFGQHSYFNLDGTASVLDHELQIEAESYTPLDAEDIPTGEVSPVAGTVFDFRMPRRVDCADAAGKPVRYDMNFVLNRHLQEAGGCGLIRAATLTSMRSRVELQVWTTEPALQLYDGYKLALPVGGLSGVQHAANAGVCLEPQRFPDSPNQPQFPAAILRPGAIYRQLTEFRFRELPAADFD
jgi:aldose 1-epimerase